VIQLNKVKNDFSDAGSYQVIGEIIYSLFALSATPFTQPKTIL
jgi:hypothetical protein